MKNDTFRKSIRTRILVPIFFLISGVSLVLLIIIFNTSHTISKRYFEFVLSRNAADTAKILDTAITELIAARLLDNKVVTEAKQKAVLEELSDYWSDNNLHGVVLGHDGTVLFSSVDSGLRDLLFPSLMLGGPFHVKRNSLHINGYAIEFKAWDWKVATIARPVSWLTEMHQKDISLLLPIVLVGMVVLMFSIFLLLSRNFQRPVSAILSDLREGREVRETGISELDTMVNAINNSFLGLRRKTSQVELLHDVALSIHYESKDQTINSILDKVTLLLGTEFCALVLLDEQGNVKDLITRGKISGLAGDLLEERVIPKTMLLTTTLLRINDAAADPALRALPEGHLLKNVIISPIASGDRHLGALFFANKPEGYKEEDEALLKALSADTAVTLIKAENVMELKRFKQVIDSAFDIIMIADEEGNITYINPAAEMVTGYASEELLGKKVDLLFGAREDLSLGEIWKTVLSGNVWRGEFRNRKQDGDIYHTSALVFPLRGAEETSIASIQRDITHEKRLYEQLLRAQKLEAIGTLAGGVAHDFNNILTVILGYADIMSDMVKEGDPFFKPLHTMQKAAEQGAELTKKILSITRKDKTVVKPVFLNEIITSSMELLERSIPKTIEIKTDLAEGIPPVQADSSQLQQIIMNLSINARDAMPLGGKLVIGTEYASDKPAGSGGLQGSGDFVKLFISDTGAGMDIETQRKIFDPFYTTKEAGKGTGLGLYIVHSIVNSYGGNINVYSEPGMGSVFSIYLPVSAAKDAEEISEIEDLSGTGTVLVIDDEPHVRELCNDMLVLLGYKVLSAGGGAEGIQIFKEMKDRISVVVLDMIMPKMGGSEVFEVLKAIQPDVRVILCSGYNQEGLSGIETLLNKGAKKFIQKPFSRTVLGRALKDVIKG